MIVHYILKTISFLIPAMVPSWRFFDTIGASPRIEYTVLPSEDAVPEQWLPLTQRPASIPITLHLKRMFYNAKWNEMLFLTSCAERISEHNCQHAISYIAESIKKRLCASDTGIYMQFRLKHYDKHDGNVQSHITFLSKPYLLNDHAPS